MLKNYLLPLLLLTLLCTSGRAQRVEQTFGPEFYEEIKDADIAPGGSGWAVGSCGLYLKTTNGGDSWTDVSDRFTGRADFVTCLPGTNCQTVFMPGRGNILASFDGGDSWEEVASDAGAGKFDFSVDGVIFGWYPGRSNLVKSTDGGRNWTLFETAWSIRTDLLVISETELGFFDNQQYYYSTDGGATFSEGGTLDQNASLVTIANNGDLLAVGRNTKMFRSTDKGLTWTVLNERIFQYTVHNGLWQDDADVLHYLTFLGIHVISTDGGLSWERISNGPRLWSARGYRLLEDGSHLGFGNGNSLHRYNTTDDTYDYLLGDVHPDFQRITFAPDGQTGFAITRDDLLYKSTNGGQAWAYVTNTGGGDPVGLHAFSIDQVLALLESGNAQISNDGGETFADLNLSPTFSGFNGAAMWPINDEEFFLANRNTFGRVKTNGDIVYANDWTQTGSDLYFVNEQLGFEFGRRSLRRTTDGGVTWSTPTTSEDIGFTVYDMHFFDDQNGVLLGRPTFETTDGGATWTKTTDFQAGNSFATSLTGDTLFIHNIGKVYQTLNADPSVWEEVVDLGCGNFANKLLRRPGSTELFTFQTSGIARIDFNRFPVGTRNTPSITPLKLYPNPTDGLVKLDLPTLPGRNATAEVFSVGGQRVRSISLAGTDGQLDLSGHPSGIYTVRVMDDGKLWTGRVVVR